MYDPPSRWRCILAYDDALGKHRMFRDFGTLTIEAARTSFSLRVFMLRMHNDMGEQIPTWSSFLRDLLRDTSHLCHHLESPCKRSFWALCNMYLSIHL
ncbi:hypothetical protein PsorP6_011367 [Peronosclerospora sorghi]|uniref:Uncharacterized protein n=1 Tax=Peronosclerospora sorghi TaxID=230839 RepID=A0ACC0WK33_9STRA|nr:hypothetical protein PsorP6_011367 [Peronosclerospora sorghi]